jgi:hypothetical protein
MTVPGPWPRGLLAWLSKQVSSKRYGDSNGIRKDTFCPIPFLSWLSWNQIISEEIRKKKGTDFTASGS